MKNSVSLVCINSM